MGPDATDECNSTRWPVVFPRAAHRILEVPFASSRYLLPVGLGTSIVEKKGTDNMFPGVYPNLQGKKLRNIVGRSRGISLTEAHFIGYERPQNAADTSVPDSSCWGRLYKPQ